MIPLREPRQDSAPAAGGPVVALLPPTAEMRRFARLFDRLLGLASARPGALQRVVAGGMVVPAAHFANLSLDFQAYLFAVFHRRRVTLATHAVLQPLTVIALCAGLAGFRVHGLGGAWIAGIALAAWWAAQGVCNGMALLGGLMAIFGLCSAAAGSWLSSLPRPPAGAARVATSPWAWVVALSFLVMISHVAEPLLPPRLNGRARWSAPGELFRRPEGGLRPAGAIARGALRIALLGIVWGTVNELWAFWRLTPVSALRALWALGYQPARRARVDAAVAAALASGNPALDFVGIGGAAALAGGSS